MELQTFEAQTGGKCDTCPSEIKAGDQIALLGNDRLCEYCVQDHRELDAA